MDMFIFLDHTVMYSRGFIYTPDQFMPKGIWIINIILNENLRATLTNKITAIKSIFPSS